MEIDFHFGVTYAVARIAGFDHSNSEIIATCSQYVDDTVNSGVVNFRTGEAFNRISSAHKLLDYKITLPVDERQVWVPFHFLPGNDSQGDHGDDFFNRVVCKPNSQIAKAMVRSCILKRNRPFGVHQLGITAHVFIDTWAHQGFAGIKHPINIAREIELKDPADDFPYLRKILEHGGISAVLVHAMRPLLCSITNHFFPMGHGAVLHYPDHPFRRWSYKNGLGNVVERDNPADFLEAADELCKVFRRFLLGDPEREVEGLPKADKDIIRQMVEEQTEDDPHLRLANWLTLIGEGKLSFGCAEIRYNPYGPGSWKHQALGTTAAEVSPSEKFEYTAAFLSSNWKLFHEAAQAHQVDILREILPSFGICAI